MAKLFHDTRIIYRDYATPKRLKVTYSTSRKWNGTPRVL